MSVSITARTQAAQLLLKKRAPRSFLFGKKHVVFPGRPLVMGIVNVTPDSFSDGGCFLDKEKAIAHGIELIEAGADLLDIGGESTRPGSTGISAEEELSRVLPVVGALSRCVRVPLSIDTTKAIVAKEALKAGASVINDISALTGDAQMAAVAAGASATVILMHRQGTPRTMQRNPRYRNVAHEVAQFLVSQASFAEKSGINRSRIWIDPGFGFGKSVAHNLLLMRSLKVLVKHGFPVVIGPSRKSFIGKTLDTDIGERLSGTLACVAWTHLAGVQMVRVHDVRETVHLLKMLKAIEGS